ncbi:UNVERIFIED_CONTAM: DUF21 domain-containing protein [Sesamum calycinum]|uniref:DUF21 domain-containing protein n=1 Tax=Sesamum calycinum TaxID=2727403 RepID=A0AAW2P9B5_9LAMI
MADDIPCCETKFFLFVLIIIGLVTFAGLMAGLTLGLIGEKSASFALHTLDWQLSGDGVTSHILGQACASMGSNSGVSHTHPHVWRDIASSNLYSLWINCWSNYGTICSPSSLAVLPVAYPISKFLDWMLGKGHAALLRRAELKTFVDFHGNEAGKGGDLTHDETTIIAGALELTEKTAKDAMTPIAKAFSLDLDGTLNLETLNAIMTMGHSRVPVYYKNPNNIIGLILVKNLLAVDPDDSVPLRKMLIRKIPRVSENMPLYDILNEFQKGHSHLAVVYKDSKETKETLQKTKEDNQNFAIKSISNEADSIFNKADDQVKKSPPSTPAFKKRHRGCSFCILDLDTSPIPEFSPDQEVVGVITMEDVIEELLQEEILDETDEYVNIHNRIKINMNASQDKAHQSNSNQSLPPASAPPLQSVASKVNSGLAGFKFKLLSSQECAGVVA